MTSTAPMQPTRIAVVDDHPCIIAGLRHLFEETDEFAVVGEATHPREAVSMVDEVAPDLVIMDLSLPETNGVELGRQLMDRSRDTRIVAFTMYSAETHVRQSLRAGVRGYVLKSSEPDVLLHAINAVSCGGFFVDGRLSYALGDTIDGRAEHNGYMPDIEDEVTQKLTEREESVLRYVALGYTGKEIAGKLDLSAKTVETYKVRATQKLSLYSRADIVRHAISQGWMQALIS